MLRIERDEVVLLNNAIIQHGAPLAVGWQIIANVSSEIELNARVKRSVPAISPSFALISHC
jgi:hypothetical protein